MGFRWHIDRATAYSGSNPVTMPLSHSPRAELGCRSRQLSQVPWPCGRRSPPWKPATASLQSSGLRCPARAFISLRSNTPPNQPSTPACYPPHTSRNRLFTQRASQAHLVAPAPSNMIRFALINGHPWSGEFELAECVDKSIGERGEEVGYAIIWAPPGDAGAGDSPYLSAWEG